MANPAKASFMMWILLLVALSSWVLADHKTHRYAPNEPVAVFVNTVGPYKNPTETYGYYEKLPYCHPDTLQPRPETLGEVLEGHRLTLSGYDVRFQDSVAQKEVCTMTLTKEDIEVFKKSIEEVYCFQMFLDDLPVWNFIGSTQTEDGESQYYLFTHLQFMLQYHGDRVVQANVSGTTGPDSYVILNDDLIGQPIALTFSTVWTENKHIFFHKRMDLFAQHAYHHKELQIHWFSIINSVLLVALLFGFLFVLLMRILRNDYFKYTSVEEDIEEEAEEYGWKLIHGEVFRFPEHKMLLCSILGCGAQFLVMAAIVIILGGVGLYYPYNRGSMKTSGVILYALTSVIAGFVSSSCYKQIGGDKWVWNIVLTATLFAVPLFVVWCVLNTVAWSYRSTQALPFGTIFIIMLIWLCFGFPLTVFGGIAGKHRAGEFDAPCRTRNIPRQIPPCPKFHHPLSQMFIGGFLPMSAISVEMYYILAAIWGHKLFILYGILLLVFVILLIVTSFITIALVHFQLSFEDYHWWWRSVLNGGSTAFFIYAYAFFFYLNRSSMSGFMQSAFFFGYMIIICYMFFLMLGTVGFFSALAFIKTIYRNFKTD